MVTGIGFIGAGKVGCGFGRHIAARGGSEFRVTGYGGRAVTGAAALAEESDLLLLTVPDGEIAAVWEQLKDLIPNDRDKPLYVGHCSGSLDAGIFGAKQATSPVFFGSVHPLIAVYDRETAWQKFDGAFFTIEGDDAFARFAGELLTALGNPFRTIDADKKTLYHAASVMVSNFVCALADIGADAFRSCGLDDDFAENAWRALFLENAENIAALGPVNALTGPVERGDAVTVRRHLDALSGDAREIYLLLSRALADAARRKHPSRDDSDMRALLK